MKKRGGAASAFAVCTAELGERGSITRAHRRRVNPRGGEHWIIAAERDGRRLFWRGDAFGPDRQAVRFASSALARRFAGTLRGFYPRALKGWRLVAIRIGQR